MAKAKVKKPRHARPSKVKQTYLPDMEPPKIDALDKLILQVVDIHSRQKELEDDEERATADIVELMKHHKLPRYETESGYFVVHKSSTTDKISIKKRKEKKPTQPSENGDGE